MQIGPQISPTMYRELFKPRHAILWNKAKKLCSHVKVGLHCCSGVYPILRDLIEAGLDSINPVPFTCADMQMERLKREFGRGSTFWVGGCDTREMLLQGTSDQIGQHEAANVATMAPGGGFVFRQVHSILDRVPLETIMAMISTVRP